MNIVVLMSHCPREAVLVAMFDRWAFPYSRLHKTQVRSVTLGWVYVLWTHEGEELVASIMNDLPVEYMGPWEFIPSVW